MIYNTNLGKNAFTQSQQIQSFQCCCVHEGTSFVYGKVCETKKNLNAKKQKWPTSRPKGSLVVIFTFNGFNKTRNRFDDFDQLIYFIYIMSYMVIPYQ